MNTPKNVLYTLYLHRVLGTQLFCLPFNSKCISVYVLNF